LLAGNAEGDSQLISVVLKTGKSQPSTCEICILAGGLSQRLGRDKARLRLGKRTMLTEVRSAAKALGWPVRVIRRDCVPRCGPLGGIYTALKTTKSDKLLFLACDMPFVRAALMEFLLRGLGADEQASFVRSQHGRGAIGFPFVLRRCVLPIVAKQIEQGKVSVRDLATALKARIVRLPRSFEPQLRNVNTPEEWRLTRKAWQKETSTIEQMTNDE